jgi:hypothetical protein
MVEYGKILYEMSKRFVENRKTAGDPWICAIASFVSSRFANWGIFSQRGFWNGLD